MQTHSHALGSRWKLFTNARSAKTKTARCSSLRFAELQIMSRISKYVLSSFSASSALTAHSARSSPASSVQFSLIHFGGWCRANREHQSGNLRTQLNANPSKMEREEDRMERSEHKKAVCELYAYSRLRDCFVGRSEMQTTNRDERMLRVCVILYATM